MTGVREPAAPADCAGGGCPAGLGHSDYCSDQLTAPPGIGGGGVPLVSVGGEIGPFVAAGYLRIAGGLGTCDIRLLSNLSHPWQTCEYLTRVSQIPRQERIRSGVASRPDNIWGFPSYAVPEAARHRTVSPLPQVLAEPVSAGYSPPRLGAVLAGIAREAGCIRYRDMLVPGQMLRVRRFAVAGLDEAAHNSRKPGSYCRQQPEGAEPVLRLRSAAMMAALGAAMFMTISTTAAQASVAKPPAPPVQQRCLATRMTLS